jgi:hypothetical protein
MEASYSLYEGKEAYGIVQWWDSLTPFSKHSLTFAHINRVHHFSLFTSHPLEPGKGLYVCNFTHTSLIHIYTMLRLRNCHYHRCCCCRHRHCRRHRCTIPQFLLSQTTVCCGLPHSLQHIFVGDPVLPLNQCTVSLDIILSLYIWRHHVTLKWWCQPTNLHSVKTHSTANI